jgi:hypothetical protein
VSELCSIVPAPRSQARSRLWPPDSGPQNFSIYSVLTCDVRPVRNCADSSKPTTAPSPTSRSLSAKSSSKECPTRPNRSLICQVYTVAIWFGFSGKMKDMFCYIATNARYINLGFPRGSTLPDPNRVLEGDGKTMRHRARG